MQEDGQRLQTELLQQLKKTTEPGGAASGDFNENFNTFHSEISTDSFLESINSSKRRKYQPVQSSLSSDESDDPSLEVLKSHRLQEKVDKRIKELVQSFHCQGKLKYKSQRGGDIDVQVKHKVHWPHEAILGGTARQRVSYDQLTLTQWVQWFCRNILEKSGKRKDVMIPYLADLYLTSEFALTFPTVDDITTELTRLGRGALLYKVNVSRAFRHVKVDPGDYDLLGLHWQGFYIDMCVPFWMQHGSQIFQCLSDSVRYMMHEKGFPIIDYIDDYVGVPSVA